jgi:hypothetical protein
MDIIDKAFEGYESLMRRLEEGNLIFWLGKARDYADPRHENYDKTGKNAARCLNEALTSAEKRKDGFNLSAEEMKGLKVFAGNPLAFCFRIKYGRPVEEVEGVVLKYKHPDDDPWLPNKEPEIEKEPEPVVPEKPKKIYVKPLEKVVEEPIIKEPKKSFSEANGVEVFDMDNAPAYFYAKEFIRELDNGAPKEVLEKKLPQLGHIVDNNEDIAKREAEKAIKKYEKKF